MIAIPVRVDEKTPVQWNGLEIYRGNVVAIDVRLFAEDFRKEIIKRLALRRAKGDNKCPAEAR